ncbi:MAG: MFS transporter [Alphaproteobacteria bacterium]
MTKPVSQKDTAESGVRSLFGDSNFVRLWLTGSASGSMRWLETLAVSVYVFEVTESAFLVAVMMAARMAPMLLGAAVGALAERFNRRTILLSGLAIMTTVSAIMGALALSGAIEIWQIAIGAFLTGLFFASEFPVRRTILGEIAGQERIGAALSLDSASNNATRMIGPVIGGILFETVGLHGAYFMAAGFYATGFLLITGVRYRRVSPTSAIGLFTSIAEGLRYIRTNRRLVGILLVTVFVNLFGFPFTSMVPVIGKDVLGLSPIPVGFLMSAEGMGSFTGALLLTVAARPRYFARIYMGGAVIFLSMTIMFSLSSQFGISMALLLTAGLGVSGFAAMQSVLIFSTAPPEIRSRVMGVLTMCIGAGPIGVLHVGLMAKWFGAQNALTIIGLEGLACVVACALIWPELWRRNRPAAP